MATITIPGKTRKSIDIELVGTEYTVRPPKASVAVFLSQALKDAGEDAEKLLDGLEKWNLVLFGKEIGPKVTERLKDPDDDLDIPDVVELISAVMETSGGNPTT
ncbi:MAG: hypothetical protein HXL63_01490 [Thermobifida sp.]|nr:hypothetical protein [Thermobifida sp.]